MSQPSSSTLRNKVVVITGASSGVGRAAALAFAKAGARLILAARREAALHTIATECSTLGAAAITIPTDVTDAAAVATLAKAAADWGPGIDVWINNAGVLAVGPLDATPIEVTERVINTNLLGYIRGAHAVLPYFKAQGYGVLINNISIGGWVTVPYGVAYSAAKLGLRGFGEALHAELSPWPRIHVCNLYPSFLDTPGMLHAANYTGAELKTPALVFDPESLAKTMVRAALHPRRSIYPDISAPLIKLSYATAPALVGRLAEKILRTYFERQKPAAATSGNLFDTHSPYTGIHGGAAPKQKKLLMAGLAGVAAVAGLMLLSRKRQ